MAYFVAQSGQLTSTPQAAVGMQRLAEHPQLLLPPVISTLHQNFRAWGESGFSPGPVLGERIWLRADGALAVAFAAGHTPRRLASVGLAPDLAAWLVLLDCWMETFVVVARARAVWSVGELAGALRFLSPAWLPPALLHAAPVGWMRVAGALAAAVADGPLRGTSADRHWQA